MSADYGPSREQLDRLRHGSISQAERISWGVQGEVDEDAYIAPYRRPGYYVKRGVTPPQWMNRTEYHGERVCVRCGKPFQGERGEWDGDVLVFRHADGDCRIGDNDE